MYEWNLLEFLLTKYSTGGIYCTNDECDRYSLEFQHHKITWAVRVLLDDVFITDYIFSPHYYLKTKNNGRFLSKIIANV